MYEVSIIGIDLAKNSFQLHGAQSDGSIAFRKKLSRTKNAGFFWPSQPRCTVAMEACGSAHHWGREIGRLGPCGAVDPAGLRQGLCQAAEERRRGRGGDLRGGHRARR